MKLEILQVPDCPNVPVLEERIRQATAGQELDVEITHRVIDDPATASAAGMTGSPTLLIDGHDPFATPGQVSSVSCRLYQCENGGINGAPSVAALRAALGLEPTAGAAPHAAADCCTPSGNSTSAAGLDAWRSAARPADAAEQAVHRAILRAYAAHGRAPTAANLTAVAAEFDRTAEQILIRLHDCDVIRLDPAGNITSAYPFSTSATAHSVRIADGATVYAMCAVDALGIPAMLDTDAVIESADPSTGEPIIVTIHDRIATAVPVTAVVFIGALAAHGPSAESCCDYLNFFTDRDSAQTWANAHPHIGGTIADLPAARELGERIFGSQLPSRGSAG